ncbi:hypothetical protein CO151_06055 [bacterium CG_4_9_14_3_um_filter_65_15]|nr:MAG: hypothetical protein CO151_06055 [bacterium CG_4_9_14_3_um_filter_65_15]
MNQGTAKTSGPGRPRTIAKGMILTGWSAAALILGGCDLAKPELPSFDTRLTLPLGTEVLTVAEAVADDSTLVTDGEGGISFVTGGQPQTIDLGIGMEVQIPAQTIRQTVGVFAVASPAPLTVDESLAEVWPEAVTLAGSTTLVPQFDFTVDAGDLALSGIEAVALASGVITCAVTSSWPVGISGSGQGDPLLMVLRNGGTGADLMTISLGPVSAGGSTRTEVSLAGMTLPSRLEVSIVGHGDGALSPVPIAGDESLSVELSFSELSATSATAAVEAQTFDLEFTADLSDGDAITHAAVGTGSLSFYLRNELPLDVAVDLAWDRVIRQDGTALTTSAVVPAAGSVVVTVPFSAGEIVGTGDPMTTLTATAQVRTSGSGGETVALSSTQGLAVDLAPGVLSFTEISGCFAPDSWDLDPVTEQISYPDDSEGLTFTQAALVIELGNTADMGADLDLRLTGVPDQGEPVYLEVHEFVDPAGDGSGKTILILDENNSELVDFLNTRPQTISLGGTAGVADGANCGTLRSSDTLEISWRLTVPVVVTLEGTSLAGDPEPLELDADLQSAISDHAGAAELQATVTNHLPAGLQLWVLVADRPEDLPGNPLLTVGPLTVDAALIDPFTGEVAASVVSRPSASLTAEESRLFGRPGLHTLYRVRIPASDGIPVRLMSTDFLEVSGLLAMDLRIDEEL